MGSSDGHIHFCLQNLSPCNSGRTLQIGGVTLHVSGVSGEVHSMSTGKRRSRVRIALPHAFSL